MEELRNTVLFEDENGQQLEMELLDTFAFENNEYAVFLDTASCACGCHEEDHEHEEEAALYVMQVVKDQDGEEAYIAVEESAFDALAQVVETRLKNIFPDAAPQ